MSNLKTLIMFLVITSFNEANCQDQPALTDEQKFVICPELNKHGKYEDHAHHQLKQIQDEFFIPTIEQGTVRMNRIDEAGKEWKLRTYTFDSSLLTKVSYMDVSSREIQYNKHGDPTSIGGTQYNYTSNRLANKETNTSIEYFTYDDQCIDINLKRDGGIDFSHRNLCYNLKGQLVRDEFSFIEQNIIDVLSYTYEADLVNEIHFVKISNQDTVLNQKTKYAYTPEGLLQSKSVDNPTRNYKDEWQYQYEIESDFLVKKTFLYHGEVRQLTIYTFDSDRRISKIVEVVGGDRSSYNYTYE